MPIEDSIENSEVWKNRGNDFFKNDDFENALKCYTIAIEINPNNSAALHNLGLTFLKLGRMDEAKKIQYRIKEISTKKEGNSSTKKGFRSKSEVIRCVKELIWVVVILAGVLLALFLVSGTWPAVVTIESETMAPHMNFGDLVFVVSADRYGELQSWTEGKESGYQKFGDYGDLLVYRPNGADNSPIPIPFISGSVHPIIHRAMGWTAEGETIPKYLNLYRGQASPVVYLPAMINDQKLILKNGTVINDTTASPDIGYIVQTNVTAANSGYITKGDDNLVSDQGGYLSRRDLGIIQPVKKEWILGKALFTIPFLGYVMLYPVPFSIVVIFLIIIWELYSRRKNEDKN